MSETKSPFPCWPPVEGGGGGAVIPEYVDEEGFCAIMLEFFDAEGELEDVRMSVLDHRKGFDLTVRAFAHIEYLDCKLDCCCCRSSRSFVAAGHSAVDHICPLSI